jgi:HD-GYP domain-containing protein (c-di-GMP phosphodiesterase class II)
MVPHQSGRKLILELIQRYPDTAIITMTSPVNIEPAVEMMKMGAYDYVIKPVRLNELPIRIWKTLERRNLRIRNREYELSLEKRVEAQTRQIRKAFQNSIKSLAYALEARDEYTGGHSQRVSQYAYLIANRLGTTRKQIEKIRQAALVHDIGKIGIRESVLMKKEDLTDDEFQHIAAHSVIGEHILRPAIDDDDILKMVRHHHERYDGKGYPDGLSGVQIPQGARVLAVADMYDAMTSNRPYRNAVSPESAISELKRQTGYMFDPVVVNAFFQILSGAYEYTRQRPIISFNPLNTR